ncbi:MAG: 16S rRNA processing protein RimM [Halobacteriovoraceae bacterium]|nr:16S rRNA processing protein RimM [Halobacteriovoraceae bacterium]
MESKLVELGTCHKPHGIKGEFSFHLYNKDASVIKKGSVLILIPLSEVSALSKNGEPYKVAQISFGNKVICKLEEVKDRNKVEELIPFKIMLHRSDFPRLRSGEFYLYDFIGLNIIDSKGEIKGVVENFYENNSQVILVLDLSREKIELPFIESFFPNVDWEKREITFIEPETF